MKKLVRRGRVRGYRPERKELEDILELAQRGIKEGAVAQLKYSQGDTEISSLGGCGKITPANLEEIVNEAQNPNELNNLHFMISQEHPVRGVDIQIGPGDWTTYLVESEDQTWAYGRYHELTDKLLGDRSLYAKGHSASPQTLQEGTDNKWRPAPWELVSDWRMFLVGRSVIGLCTVFLIEAIIIGLMAGNYYDPGPHTKADMEAQRNAELTLHWLGHNSPTLFFVNVFYLLMTVFLARRVRSLLKSRVILQSSSFWSQFRFQANKDNAVPLAGIYISLLGIIVSVMIALVT